MTFTDYINNNANNKKIVELKNNNIINNYEYDILVKLQNNSNILNNSYILDILNGKKLDIKQLEINTNIIKKSKKSNKYIITTKIYDNLINSNFPYSDDQKNAIKKIIKFITNNNDKMFRLYGYAGTGKTTTIVNFICYLLDNKYLESVIFTAPTNKAVNIIKHNFSIKLEYLFNKYVKYDNNKNYSFDDMIDELKKVNIKIEFITIHKLLNYKTDYSINDGSKIFIKSTMVNLLNTNLIIIDECSMIQMNMVYNLILEIIDLYLTNTNSIKNLPKTLFLGDPCQLPPVGEKKSLIFLNKNENIIDNINFNEFKKIENNNILSDEFYKLKFKKIQDEIYNINTYTMKNVVRSNSNNIVGLCNNIRDWIENKIKIPTIYKFKSKDNNNSKSVFVYKKTLNKLDSGWFKKYIEYYNLNDNNTNIIIAWTNKQCDIYNNEIRKIVLGKTTNLNKYEIGDILVLNDFYILNNNKNLDFNNKYHTSEQIKIIDLVKLEKMNDSFSLNLEIKKKINKNLFNNYTNLINKINIKNVVKINYWNMKVRKITHNKFEENILYEINVLELNDKYENIKIDISKYIDEFNNDIKYDNDYHNFEKNIVLKTLWYEFNKVFIDSFANVNLGCAISSHKSQSSTYDRVFVDVDDIFKNQNNDEVKQCIYTSFSRPSKEIHILI